MSHILSICSGKGGVGKTNLSVNLAVCLARKGFSTCLFDADLGLANVNILLGMSPEYTLADLIEGRCGFADLLVKGMHGIDIIPGSTGVSMIADLSTEDLERLTRAMAALDNYDYVLVDTSAGISRQVLAFCMMASRMILTIIPEPTSLTDAYSLLKVLYQNGFETPVHVVVNRCKNVDFGGRVFDKFNDTVRKFLPIHLKYLGSVAEDEHVSDAVANQTPFSVLFPECQATRDVNDVAILISRPYYGLESDRTIAHMVENLRQPIETTVSKNKQVRKASDGASPNHGDVPDKNIENTIERDEFITQALMALNRLVENTERIGEELHQLRKTMGTDAQDMLPRSTAGSTGELPAPVINLDFEKFVREKKGALKPHE